MNYTIFLFFIYFPLQLNCWVYDLAICAMFKNEAPWLKEWIEYHRLIGVEHFYLYNNDSTDHFESLLEPYLHAGIVELIDWNSLNPSHRINGIQDIAHWPYQFGAYNDCLKNRALGVAKWVAIVDIDEYIVPVHGSDSLHKFLERSLLYKVGSLILHWRNFGTSNLFDLTEGDLLIEKLFRRMPDDHEWHQLTKCIHHPEAIAFCLIHNAAALHLSFKPCRLNPADFRIHHYWTRTEKACAEKRGLTKENSGDLLKKFNSVEDRSIFPYIPELKRRLKLSAV